MGTCWGFEEKERALTGGNWRVVKMLARRRKDRSSAR
jgi:hypothetical protein